ncbi:hypothetical protein [uncultured Flavobacterium sp.]|uniref:hypothetical protein n=1 Tax=uncultured Flavobacterium sp. TaxID=165435 RepID=UPI0025D4D2A1|nr:hypothetical protein [uncultured Flavobacterium sp.]
MNQLSKCCISLILVLLAVASSYGKESHIENSTALVLSQTDTETPITLQNNSLYIKEGTITNLEVPASKDTLPEKNSAVLYIAGPAEIYISKNSITNASPVYLKQAKKAIAKSKIEKVEKATAVSKNDTALFHALPKSKEKTTAQFTASVASPSPTTLKSNKNNILLCKNTVAPSIFRKRKASRRCLCSKAPKAFQKLKTYSLFSRPPTLFA